jgi:hypothetical protein
LVWFGLVWFVGQVYQAKLSNKIKFCAQELCILPLREVKPVVKLKHHHNVSNKTGSISAQLVNIKKIII